MICEVPSQKLKLVKCTIEFEINLSIAIKKF